MSSTPAAACSATPATAGKIPKPNMRRMYYNKCKYALLGATVFSIAATLTWKVLVVDVRKKKYAEFFANYDPVKEEKRLLEAGVFKWAPNQPSS